MPRGGGYRIGEYDPETIIARSATIQEIDPTELICYGEGHRESINILTMILTKVDSSDPREVARTSDRLQHHMPNDSPDITEVIDVLSSNAADYEGLLSSRTATNDESIPLENVIAEDPLIRTLLSIKTESMHARTLRLWRSLIAIAYLKPAAENK